MHSCVSDVGLWVHRPAVSSEKMKLYIFQLLLKDLHVEEGMGLGLSATGRVESKGVERRTNMLLVFSWVYGQ